MIIGRLAQGLCPMYTHRETRSDFLPLDQQNNGEERTRAKPESTTKFLLVSTDFNSSKCKINSDQNLLFQQCDAMYNVSLKIKFNNIQFSISKKGSATPCPSGTTPRCSPPRTSSTTTSRTRRRWPRWSSSIPHFPLRHYLPTSRCVCRHLFYSFPKLINKFILC